jgi:hypothetical protein
VKEGELAKYIAIIKTGQCRILRQIDAVVTLANAKQVYKYYVLPKINFKNK